MQNAWKKVEEVFNQGIDVGNSYKEAFFEKVEAVSKELADKKERYIALSEVIKSTWNIFSTEIRTGGESLEWLKMCPQDILNDIQNRKEALYSRSEKRELLLECAGKIAQSDLEVGTYAILFDPSFAFDVMNQLLDEKVEAYEQIREVYKLLSGRIEEGEVIHKVVMVKELYLELVSIFNKGIEVSEERWKHYYTDKNMKLKRRCQEVLSNLDIAIDVQKTEEIRSAVTLAVRVLFMEVLQKAYLYQTVYERYEAKNNASSRGLETFYKNSKESETYYFRLFKEMAELAEEDNLKQVRPEKDKLILRGHIIDACRRERQKYVNELLTGEMDE